MASPPKQQPIESGADSAYGLEHGGRLAAHNTSRDDIRKIAELLLTAATFAGVSGDHELRDRLVERAAECLGLATGP